MFRSALADFEDDPFFRDHHQQMSSMMRSFHDPFSHFGSASALPGIENGGRAGRSNRGGQQLARPTDMFGSMFGDMFANMNSMMANMHRNFEQMANDPNTYSYSSSSVMSYSSDGRGEPKYFQASKSTKKAPGGVKETQHSVRDSESGLHRMAIGHHLDDRSHMIERSMNRRSGEEERKQDFINLDENDASAFDQEWKERTRQSSSILRDRQRATIRGLEEPRERPTYHSHHAGIAAPSRKDNGTIRDMDRLRVNSEGLGAHREFDYKYHDLGQDRDRPRVTGEGPGAHRENRHYGHGTARDKDWGSGDFERAGRSRKPRQNREKHVRVNSRPVNRHEPRGGL